MRVYKNTANHYGIEDDLGSETGRWCRVEQSHGEVSIDASSDVWMTAKEARKFAAKIIEMAERAEKFNANAGRSKKGGK